MRNYITIDGGTTNTRVTLVSGPKILETVKISRGARLSMDGGDALRTEIRAAILSLLEKYGMTESDLHRILASGMITSEYGLCPLPHLVAPAGIRELHEAMHETVIPDVSSVPFVFVRGVRTVGEDLTEIDMMRGEESELIGLCDEVRPNCLYVLPGSHSKLIECDGEGRIARFSTMMTGETFMALATGTILKDAVDPTVSEFDAKFLLKGFQYAVRHGFSEAVFKTRVLKNHLGASPVEVYSFYLGVILSSEVQSILQRRPNLVVVGGQRLLKKATAALLTALSEKRTVTVSDEDVRDSSCRGVIRIYEYGEDA